MLPKQINCIRTTPSRNATRTHNITFSEQATGAPVQSKCQSPYANASQYMPNQFSRRNCLRTYIGKPTTRLNEAVTKIFKGIAESSSPIPKSQVPSKCNVINKEVTIKLSELLPCDDEDCNVGDIDDQHHYQFAWDLYND